MATDVVVAGPAPVKTPPPVRRRRGQGGYTVKTFISQSLLTLVLLLFVVPFAWMIATALKPGDEVFTNPPTLLGSEIRWDNFTQAWNFVPFGRFMFNGVLVAVLGTVLVLATSVLAAFAFAQLRFRGRDNIFLLFLGTLMLPQEVVVVPMFVLMRELGWVDSYASLILPWAFTAFGTFMLRQFFRTVPGELYEAAVVDGASKLRILLQVYLPIARPALAVLAVFTFINYWNSFLWPLIVINSTEKSTVPLGMTYFLGQHGNQWHLLMAAATISMLPTVAILLLLQKHLVKGISLSGLGGR